MMPDSSSEFRVPSSEADLLIYCETPLRAAVKCVDCEGTGFRHDCRMVLGPVIRPGARTIAPTGCATCEGAGYLGIDARLPTSCKAGSEGKIAVMAARYSQGLPLFVPGDCQLSAGNKVRAGAKSEPAECEALFEDDDEFATDAA